MLEICHHPSPNFGPRRGGAVVELVVLHHTAMENAEAALTRLCDPAAEVSSHYLIGEDGTLWQLVTEEMRAWHAGAGSWGGRGDVNSRSIGIELANPGPLRGLPPFSARQMDTLERLLGDILARHRLPPAAVIAHSDMAPERKSDPGPAFDWRRLARAGLSIWPAEAEEAPPPDMATFRAAATRFGYPADVEDAALLEAFRLRFRPGAMGPLSPGDMALIADLANRWPASRGSGAACA